MMMKSAQDPPASSEPSFILFCPICRVEKKVVAAINRPTSINDYDATINNNDDESPLSNVIPTIITQVDENKCPIYQLTNCEHKFCLPCIRAYVTSKIGDGRLSIPCCHFHALGASGNVHQCNVVVDELDIYNLLHNIVGVDDDYCCYDDDESSSLFDANHEGEWSPPRKIQGRGASSKEMRMNNMNVESHLVVNDELTSSTTLNLTASMKEGEVGGIVENELWMKYKKLKFDQDHGKNVVRRCPLCDEAVLFDFRIMKQFQDQFLTNSSSLNVVVTVDDDNVPTNSNTKRRKGILNVIRRWQNNGVIDSGGDGGTASSAKEGNNVVVNELSVTETPAMARESEYIMETRHVQEEINIRDDTDNMSLNGIEPILSSLSSANNNNNNNKEDAYITQDGGDSVKIEDETNNEQDLSYMTKTTTQNKNDDFDAEVCHLNEKAPSGFSLRRITRVPAELCYSCETVDIATIKSEVLSPPPVQLKSTTPCVTCSTCTTNFCYFHSNAHAFGTSACITYHTNSIESDRINLEFASQTLHAKSCPTCGIAVSKEGGCNQMKCGSCGTHFCWICSAIVDDGAFPEHFRWW